MLEAAAAFIRAHGDFVLIAHVSPDGDTLGSCLALKNALSSLGKNAVVVCEDPVPAIYRFLPGADAVRSPEQAGGYDAVIAVDCADKARTGRAAVLTERADTLNIDHHETNTGYLNENYVEHVAATGELIFQLFAALGLPLSQDAARCLYTAIITDTGNLSYSNTTPDTLRIVAELLETGIDLPALNRAIYRTVPFHKVRLLGCVIRNTRLYGGGRIGMSFVTLADFAESGASAEDTEGAIDSIRDVDTVELAVLLRECGDGSIRVGLRGKRSADVSKIAKSFGGGGHRLAAGCTIHQPLAAAYDLVLAEAEALLAEEDA